MWLYGLKNVTVWKTFNKEVSLDNFAEIEFLKKGGANNKTYKLSSVPITVSLPLKYGLDKDYEIIIKQINGSSERLLFSSKLPKTE